MSGYINGKFTSIYLTDEEASELKRYCHQCSQYSVLKTALREFLSGSIDESVEENSDTQEVEEQEEEQQEGKLDIIALLRRLSKASKNY
jgi:hypothetical protein